MPHRLRTRYPPTTTAPTATPPPPTGHSPRQTYREQFRSWRSNRTVSEDEVTSPPTPGYDAAACARKVNVADHELVRRALNSEAAQGLVQALERPLPMWSSSHQTDEFTVMTRSSEDAAEVGSHEVLVVGEVRCSPQEIAAVLRSADESDFNSSMRALHGDKFIYGSVVHTVGQFMDEEEHLGGWLQERSHIDELRLPTDHGLAVKTSCFVRSRFLAKNEEWCFLEHFLPYKDADGFMVVQSSMRESELAAGKSAHGRVAQLHGVTVVYLVEQLEGNSRTKAVRVTFHGLFTAGDADRNGHVTAKTAKTRLLALANAVPRLPAVVRRRRLSAQVFANTSVMGEARNARCISCTRSLHLLALTVKKRCQLCSYNVCSNCCANHKVETYNGHATTMVVCRRCLECVNRCDYSHIQFQRPEPSRVIDDAEYRGATALPPSGSGIISSLREDLSASESTKQAAITVIRHLLDSNADEEKTDDQIPEMVGGEDYSSSVTSSSVYSFSSTDECVSAVEAYFRRREDQLEGLDVELANSSRRTYPIDVDDDGVKPVAPIPDNENERLAAIDRLQLMELTPMAELDIICDFLNLELGFFCTMITIVGEAFQLVLACTIKGLVMANLPREHTFCQHLLMDDKPFLINNPEADVRFYNLNPITQNGVQFYMGIPIQTDDGMVVGSICCLNLQPMQITRSQFATLTRFGRIASKIIMVQAKKQLPVAANSPRPSRQSASVAKRASLPECAP